MRTPSLSDRSEQLSAKIVNLSTKIRPKDARTMYLSVKLDYLSQRAEKLSDRPTKKGVLTLQRDLFRLLKVPKGRMVRVGKLYLKQGGVRL